MTEEIIIDGINVSKCEHSFKQFDNWVGKDIVSCDCTLGFRCEPRKNHCKFYMEHLEQQLKLAKQKLEKLKYIIVECRDCGGCNNCKYANECNNYPNGSEMLLQIIKGGEE